MYSNNINAHTNAFQKKNVLNVPLMSKIKYNICIFFLNFKLKANGIFTICILMMSNTISKIINKFTTPNNMINGYYFKLLYCLN